MEEKYTGFEIAIKVLGERVAELEGDVRHERFLKEEANRKVEKLEAMCAKLERECDTLNAKLAEIEHYVERMER